MASENSPTEKTLQRGESFVDPMDQFLQIPNTG